MTSRKTGPVASVQQRLNQGILSINISMAVFVVGDTIVKFLGHTFFQTNLVVAREDLVAGLAGDPELSTQARHLLAVQPRGNELQSFVHGFTPFPGHLALPAKGPIV